MTPMPFGELGSLRVINGHDLVCQMNDWMCRRCGIFVADMPVSLCPGSAAQPQPTPLLLEAAATVESRGKDYGTPKENHSRTAELWQAYINSLGEDLDIVLTPRDVCMLNILQKISRDRFRPLRDNLLDIAGYAANADLL